MQLVLLLGLTTVAMTQVRWPLRWLLVFSIGLIMAATSVAG